MLRRSMSIAMGIAVIAGTRGLGPGAEALAQPAPAAAPGDGPHLETLEKRLPSGWSLLVSSADMVIRHDRPCYVTGTHAANAHVPAPALPSPTIQASPGSDEPAKPAGGGPLVTIELRYRLEPRWTEPQVAAAKATNDKLAGELRALVVRYNLDGIHRSKGKPLPATPDERTRLSAYQAAEAPIVAKMVKLPRCSLGDTSVFDGPDTYAQLGLVVDPPEVMTQAYRIVELVNQHCG